MKLNLSKLLLTAGLGLGIISFASVAEAGLSLGNGSRLTGQKTEQQPQQQLKGGNWQGSSLTGHLPQPTTKGQPQKSKSLTCNGSSLSGQTTKKQLQQQLKAIGLNGSSLTGQTTEKQPTQSAD